MGLLPLSPQNWNRLFNVWIDGIQVRFEPVARRAASGGVLRQVRRATRVSAGIVILFFSLHCTKPALAPGRSTQAPGQGSGAGEEYVETGEASWYGGGDGFEGRATASGEVMDGSKLSCAHRTLPLGSYVQVTNLGNGRMAILRINDRGPFLKGRILDVSRQAAKELGFMEAGKAQVRIRAVEKDGSPSRLAPVDLSNPLTIQVASLADKANVDRMVKELEARIGPVTLQPVVLADGRAVQRVRVGAYTSMADAQKAMELIVKLFGDRGVDPFILRRY